MLNKKDDFNIKRHIAELSGTKTTATRLNLVQFGMYPAKYDIRKWLLDENGAERSAYRGLQLTLSELRNLRKALNELPELKEGGDQ